MCYYTSEVSCPYFYPVDSRKGDDSPRTALLPLGGLWNGLCRAVPDELWKPEANHVRCLLGYARGECPRFPVADPGADAVRFNIARDDGASLRLSFVLERNHQPWEHGRLEYSLAGSDFIGALPGETVRRQAEAYVQTYLRRKNESRPR